MVIGKLTGKLWISIIIILGFLVYVIISKGYKSSADNTTKVPTKTYMKYVGGRCPDYFDYLGTENDKDICQNTYGITVNNTSGKCYTDDPKYNNQKVIEFPTYNKWPLKKDSDSKKERCTWIQNCGLSDSQFASWSGMKC